MASGKTERRALPFPLKIDPDTAASDIGSLAKALDNDAETGQGEISKRPKAGIRGRFFYVTGSEEGLYWDTGAVWTPIGTDIEKAQLGLPLLGQIEQILTIKSLLVPEKANKGELILCLGGIEIKTPTPAANAVFGVLANGHTVEIVASSGKIYGVGRKGESAIILSNYQYAILQSDGTNWYVTSGIPRGSIEDLAITEGRALIDTENKLEESKPTVAEMFAGIIPSTSSPAIVTAWSNGSTEAAEIDVEGKIACIDFESGKTATFFVPKGGTWKINRELAVLNVTVQTVLLAV